MSRKKRSKNNEENGVECECCNNGGSSKEFLVDLSEELRTIYLFGYLGEKTVFLFIKHWDKIESIYDSKTQQNSEPITIVINSSGGQSIQGLALHNKIRYSGVPIKTVGIGEISSAAMAVFLAGRERLLYPDTLIGFHQCQPDLCPHSDRSAAELEVSECKLIDSRYHRVILENSNLTRRQVVNLEKRSKYITAEEAVKYGLAHGIIK